MYKTEKVNIIIKKKKKLETESKNISYKYKNNAIMTIFIA